MDKETIIFKIVMPLCICIGILSFIALNVIWLTKTISLKDLKCIETEHTKDRDGCVLYKYIGGIEE